MEANLCKRVGNEDNDRDGVLSLPDDVVLEMLLRLPARALCQFRCVCKAWRALITDPSFAAAQRSHATGPFIVAMFGSAPDHELRLLDTSGNVFMVFDVRGRTTLLARAQLGAMIIDPASGRNFTVVGTKDPPSPWWDEKLTPTAMMSEYSFGRAAASGDYKVLRLVTSSCWTCQRCEVATIIDGSVEPAWRQRAWGPFHDTIFSCEQKATVNGVLYFMPYKTNSPSHATKHIAAFDLESEKWKHKMIKCPPFVRKEDSWRIALSELKGTLCVVQNIRHLLSLDSHYVNIWLLMDPKKSIWVKEYGIQMPGKFLVATKPLDVLGDGAILLLLNMTWKAENVSRYILQFYNSSSDDFIDFMEMAPGFNGTMALYTGSLLS